MVEGLACGADLGELADLAVVSLFFCDKMLALVLFQVGEDFVAAVQQLQETVDDRVLSHEDILQGLFNLNSPDTFLQMITPPLPIRIPYILQNPLILLQSPHLLLTPTIAILLLLPFPTLPFTLHLQLHLQLPNLPRQLIQPPQILRQLLIQPMLILTIVHVLGDVLNIYSALANPTDLFYAADLLLLGFQVLFYQLVELLLRQLALYLADYLLVEGVTGRLFYCVGQVFLTVRQTLFEVGASVVFL